MKIYEIGTGYTSIPARMGAATEIVVAELTHSMQKMGKDVTIVDIKDKNREKSSLPIIEAYMPQFFSTGAVVELGIVHKLKRVLYSISLTCKLKKLIRKEEGEIVIHFHNQYNMFFFMKLTSATLRKRVKVVYTTHSYIWNGDWDAISDTVSKRYFQEVFCVQNADVVFVLNEKTIDHFTKHLGVDSKKIILIANGVNTEVYKPITCAEKETIKAQHNLSGKNVYFQAGSVCERKNQLGAIKSLLPFLKKDKNRCFVYVGGIIQPEYQEKIVKFSQDNDIEKQVIYKGEVTPGKVLNGLYNISDAFIFPSTSEGFSLVILEAMSAGLPVFVNKKNGLKLPNEGEYGCIAYDDNFEQLFEQKILNADERTKQSAIARKVIENKYGWDIVAKEYLNVFK